MDPLAAEEPILGNPMQIKLPFKCHAEVANWELLAFDNLDREFNQLMGRVQQHFLILSIDLLGIEKTRKNRPTGGMLGSPDRQVGYDERVTPDDDGGGNGGDGDNMVV